MYNDNSLLHFGIMGMHWGQRKARVATSTSTTSQTLRSRQLRPHLTTTTTTVKVVKNPNKKELKAFYEARRNRRINGLKQTAVLGAAFFGTLGAIHLANYAVDAAAWNLGKVVANVPIA